MKAILIAMWMGIHAIQAMTCLNSTYSNNTIDTVAYTYATYPDIKVMVSNQGVNTDFNYFYSTVIDGSSNEYSMYSIYTKNDTFVTERIYQIKPGYYAFDLTDDSLYAFSLSDSSVKMQIIQFDASNFDLVGAYFTTSYYTDPDSMLSTSSDNITVFISGYQVTTNYPAVGRWNTSDSNFDGFEMNGYSLPKLVYGLSSLKGLVVTSQSSTPQDVYISKFDFVDSSDVLVYMTRIDGPAGSGTLLQSRGSKSTDYTFLSLAYDSTVLFILLNDTTGLTSESMYKLSGNPSGCTAVHGIERGPDAYFFVFECTTSYIFKFDTATNEFSDFYETTDNSLKLYDYTQRTSLCTASGYYFDGTNYIAYFTTGTYATIAGFTNVYTSTVTVEVTTDYPIVSDTGKISISRTYLNLCGTMI